MQYHAQRLQFLTALKSEGRLDEWRVTPEVIGARTKSVQVTLEEDGFSLFPRGTVLSEDALDLVRRAFLCASPPSYHFTVRFQYLVAITSMTYDEARQVALGRLSLGTLGASDFALVMDGRAAEDRWHAEVGVLSDKEVEPRLRRWVSNSEERETPVPSFVNLPQEVPAVSLYLHVGWLSSERDGKDADSVDVIADRVRHLRAETGELAVGIMSRLFEEALEPVAGGIDS